MLWGIAGALLAFQAGVSTAVVNNKCSGTSKTKIDAGITDAIKMANSRFAHPLPLGYAQYNHLFNISVLSCYTDDTDSNEQRHVCSSIHTIIPR